MGRFKGNDWDREEQLWGNTGCLRKVIGTAVHTCLPLFKGTEEELANWEWQTRIWMNVVRVLIVNVLLYGSLCSFCCCCCCGECKVRKKSSKIFPQLLLSLLLVVFYSFNTDDTLQFAICCSYFVFVVLWFISLT